LKIEKVKKGSNNKFVYIIDKDFSESKEFVWSSLESIKPQCVVKAVNLNVTEE